MKDKATTKPFYNSTIPSDWEVKKLGTLVEIVSGVSPSLFKLDVVGKYPYLKVEDLNNCQKYQTESREYSDDEKNVVPTNSVIFPKRGAAILNNKVRINSVAMQMDSNLMAIYPKSQHLSYEYLYYQIIFEQLHKIADTSTIPQINNKHIIPYSFLLPPLPEQKAIAHILGLMDTAINKNNLLIAQKELQKKWLMQNLLTGKKRLKGHNEKWKEVRLNDVAEIDKLSLGNQTPADYSFQYLTLSDIDSGNAEIKSVRIAFSEAPSRARRIVTKGDVLLATVRPNLQGFVIIRDTIKDLIASTGFAVITCTKINNEFLFQYLFTKNLMKQIESFLVGSNYPAINSSDVKNLKIPYPPLKEQTAIAQVLQAADKEIQLLKTKSEKLREQKKGMMQVLLTGKKRLKL